MTALLGVRGLPPGVRVVNLAGEPLLNRLVQDIYGVGTVEKVYNLYGPSEDIHAFHLRAGGERRGPQSNHRPPDSRHRR